MLWRLPQWWSSISRLVYLYGSAGIDAFVGATFYLVAANRINKHGLLFAWATVYGLIQGVMGYMFLVPYFLIVALIAELCMVGKNTYRSAVRNRIGWMVNSIGNFVGCAVPLWWSWDSYQEMAASSGFDANTLNMQLSMVTSPALMLLGVVITAVLAILGTLFGQRLLRKHFQKAGIVGWWSEKKSKNALTRSMGAQFFSLRCAPASWPFLQQVF